MNVWSSGRLVVITIVMTSYISDFACGQDDNRKDAGDGDKNCHLTSQSFYGYIVRVWNKPGQNTSSHGSILSQRAILTSCAPYLGLDWNVEKTRFRPLTDFLVIGQKRRDIVDPWWNHDGSYICTQQRNIVQIRPHPKCLPGDGGDDKDLHYNFAVLVLEKPFLAFSHHTYPTIFMPTTLDALVYFVSLVNILRFPACEIPIFYFHNLQVPTLAHHMVIKSMRYVTECVPRYCEAEPFVEDTDQIRFIGHYPTKFEGPLRKDAVRENEKQCKIFLKSLMNYTMLCAYFPHETTIKYGTAWMDIRNLMWTSGAPLVCNGSAIGHTASARNRHNMHGFVQDFYLIATYVRPWDWINSEKKLWGVSPVPDNFIDKDMQDRGAKPREDGPKPVIPNDRSWSDDEKNADLMNRASMNRQLMTPFSSITAAMMIYINCL